MSTELKQYLTPGSEIPWDSAAAFFVATKESSIEKTAKEAPQVSPAASARAKGILSGIRSSSAQDVTHANRVKRTRGVRVGREVGSLGGAAAGYALGRKSGIAGKIGGATIGALLGRSVGKSVGEEKDRSRTIDRYKAVQKKAEIEKQSAVGRVRELWKLADSPSAAMEGGDTSQPGPVDTTDAALTDDRASNAKVQKGPNIAKATGAPTPEENARAAADEQMAQDAQAAEAAQQNEAGFYRQVAEQNQAQLEEASAAAQQAQAESQQLQQQAAMTQQQVTDATDQLQQQAQQAAMEKEQLSQETLAAKDTIMQMRQAMQTYRENLQQIALQDPTAMAGPSPEEMGAAGPSPGELQGMMAQQQMEKEQISGTEQEKEVAKQDRKATKQEQVVGAQEQPAMGKAAEMNPRVRGAVLGAVGAAGIQGLTDRRGPGGMSLKEKTLRTKLQHMQGKKHPSAMHKHMTTVTRAMADTAKINREHPGSAMAMAALTGAVAGASFGPSFSQAFGRK